MDMGRNGHGPKWLWAEMVMGRNDPEPPRTPQDTQGHPRRPTIPKRHIKISLFVFFYHLCNDLKIYFH